MYPLLLLCFSVVPLPVPSLPLPSSLPLSHGICGWLVESDGSQKRTHGPLCLFICPPVPRSFHRSAPSIPLLSCPISLLPLRASTHHPPPDTPTLYPPPLLSVPLLYCALAVLCSSPLRPRWTVLTLCSKINFETNKAAAVFACSVIFCQKCSEGYVLICCQGAPPPWLAAFSIYALVSKKRPSLHSIVPKKDFYSNAAKEAAAGQSNDCPITRHWGLNPIKVPLRRTQIPHLLTRVALNKIME